ncbi:unnamed protein product [Mytilus coruscus]|uniref:MYND-type domain-containing protein n=1 Tax=Mytilus coruscus TaxID=42192 RepID=A0A6J8CS21_MYTCO|nr:unnamed protein product [Mytilus coruscus]
MSSEEALAAMSDITESFREFIHREKTKDSIRTCELYNQDTEGSAVLANATRLIEPPSVRTTSIYSRSGIIPPKEANQQSDVQSVRTTIELKKNTSMPIAHNLHQVCKMPNGKHGESQKENKAERTDSELILPPEEAFAAKLYIRESFLKFLYREKTKDLIRTSEPYDQDIEGSAVPANATRVTEPTSLEKQNDSTWLFKVLDTIGVNDGYRKICREEAIIQEIISTFTMDISLWHVGSYSEGTFIPSIESDADSILCHEELNVVEAIHAISIDDIKRPSLLIVRESNTPAGYVKLQLVARCVPIMSKHWPAICVPCPGIKPFFTTDKFDRIVLSGILTENLDKCPLLSRAKNKPAAKLENYPTINIDVVQCYRCKTWPTMANEWLSRQRCYGWPTTKTIEELKLLGSFVVRKGHPFSPEIDLEWRISLSLQDRKLILNLTDVQYKCYVVLKTLNRDILRLDCITTYHWKTCLFYMIEENESTVWERKLLFHCVKLCIEKMLKWVTLGCCPNYFIPGENLFEGRMNDSLKEDSKKKLVEILNVGFAILDRVQSYNICDYMRARTHFKWFKKVIAENKKIYTEKVFMRKAVLYKSAMRGVSMLFEKIKSIEKTPNVIEIFWRMLDHIQHIKTVSEHTQQETSHALSLLLPFIYTCLASNISAMCIQQSNPQVRDFLLLGSYTYFMKGDLPGRLKFISVLYAAGCYKECAWYLDQEDEEYILKNPFACVCEYIIGVRGPPVTSTCITEIPQLKMSTCLLFLPSELPVIPSVLKFEIFKNYGISSHKTASDDYLWNWDHLASVDSNVFYFLLKFLVNREVKKVKLSTDALYDIQKIGDCLFESNVIHRDVAYNLLAWCYCSVGWTCRALWFLRQSWHVHRPLSPLIFLIKKEKKQQHHLLNSAKIHFLVILYNIWFGRNQAIFNFCFQCFEFCKEAHQKCSNCQTATYCSEKCKQINWTIHEAVCELVCSYSHV